MSKPLGRLLQICVAFSEKLNFKMVNKRGFLKIINLSLDMILNLVGVEVIAILDYMTTQVIEVGLHL